MKYTGIEDQIEFGLDTIDNERKVEVNLRDLIYVYETLQEYNRFFHQPMHYPELADVEKFLGNMKDGGAFRALHKCIYQKMRKMIPKDISDAYDDGDVFGNPDAPYYYQSKEAEQAAPRNR